jgi:hypothetical protein
MAGRASLAFLGQEDLALSADPEVTYFVEKYQGSTQFSTRLDKVQFDNGVINFGQESIIYIPKSGDLITAMYLKVLFPDLGSAQVLDSVGTLMIDFIELYIGNLLIERIYGEFIEMKFDLEVPTGKQASLQGLIGKSPVSNKTTYAPAASTYTIPLPFSCLGNGLPLCAIKDPVFFRISFAPSVLFTYPSIVYSQPVTSYLHVEYTYLSDPEVQFIKSKPQMHHIEQVQRQVFFAPVGTSNVQCLLQFVNPVKELFFLIQNNTALGYDFSPDASGDISQTEFGTGDQLVQLNLFFNSTERISGDAGTPIFLSTIQALEYHTRNPDRVFYTYSFSIDPEGDVPTGAVNMSMIKNQILQIGLASSLAARDIRVYASSYNFLNFEDGMVRLEFPNAEVS